MTKLSKYLCFLIIIAFSSNLAFSEECNTCPKDMASGELYLMSAELMNASSSKKDEEAGGTILQNQRIKIINLGPIINHEGVDYAPTISADGRTLYYVSERPGGKLFRDEDYASHDFWAAKKGNRLDTVFNEPYNIDLLENLDYLNVNTNENEGAASIAADKQTLYFTACERPDGLGQCDIYRSKIEGDRWARPVNLGKNVNSEAWDAQPSISSTGDRLYFTSTREGPNSDGKGIFENMDIWYCEWDYDMEEWLPAKNLEAINTEEQEWTPFIAADGVTLFFASDGHEPNLGNTDFYVTRLDQSNDTWTTPENLGAPINTKGQEAFITLPASGDIIYFSSTRDDLPHSQGNLDVFMAFVPTFFRAVNVQTTVIDECSGEFIPAKISIKNPITGRTIEDSVTFDKTTHEIIVSNADYGNPKDSLDHVMLEITAQNDKYGSNTVTQRVDKPSKTEDPKEAERQLEVRVRISLGQRPVLNADIAESMYIKRAKETKPELRDWRGLVMNETKTWDLYPLLSYIFFDEGISDIPERYQLFNDASQTKLFNDTTIQGGTLDKYYHILNIYGFRLTYHPEVNLTIIGNNDGETQAELRDGLSMERAMNVYNYLKDIWGISEDRLKVEARNKPAKPSGYAQDPILGKAENRRVELVAEKWDVVKPVFEVGSMTRPQPEVMNFVLNNGIEDGLVEKRRIEIKRGETVWNTLTDIGKTKERIEWDWYSEGFEYPTDEVPFTAQLTVVTKTGAECVSDPIVIPVMQVSAERKLTETIADSTEERYNLILFPFNSAEAGPLNERIMNDYVYERIKPTTYVEVIGHTDIKGLENTNLRLSEKRSATVRTGIERKTGGKYGELIQEGVGEEDPLYINDLPEGRFYNRTVQVFIKTPVEEYQN